MGDNMNEIKTFQGLELPTLVKGDSNQYVKLLQVLLNANGFDSGTADGVFGERTQKALLEFTNYKYEGTNIYVWYDLFNKL